jgi:hypothetical protein
MEETRALHRLRISDLAAVLAIVFVTGNLSRDAAASHNDPNYTAIR